MICKIFKICLYKFWWSWIADTIQQMAWKKEGKINLTFKSSRNCGISSYIKSYSTSSEMVFSLLVYWEEYSLIKNCFLEWKMQMLWTLDQFFGEQILQNRPFALVSYFILYSVKKPSLKTSNTWSFSFLCRE